MFVVSSSVLPTFAALNLGDSPYVTAAGEGEDQYDQAALDEIDRLIAGETSPFTTNDGILANPTVSSTENTLTEVNLINEHIIAEGETIGSIAEQYGIAADTILVNNGREEGTVLKKGEVLLITSLDGLIYEVKKDMFIEEISSQYNTSLDYLADLNDFTTKAHLKKGEYVIIPGGEIVAAEKEKMVQEKARLIAQQEAAKKALEAKKKQEVAAAAKRKTVVVSKGSSFKATGATTATGTTYQGKSMIWPTVGTKSLSQGYGRGHTGLDIVKLGATRTTAIVAARGGKVIRAQGGWNGGYGNMILIDHGGGVVTLYGHMKEYYVKVGQQVSSGEKIGWMGNTGNVRGATGLHLHFEVKINGRHVNPMNYL